MGDAMTEAEWLACTDPKRMLEFMRGKASDRKLRLFACAYCRSVWQFMAEGSRRAVLLGEQMADGPVEESHRSAVVRAAIESVCRFEKAQGDFFMAADMAYRVPCNSGWYAVEWTIGNWSPPLASAVPIIRDIFGNPFRLVALDPGWRTPKVMAVAQATYDERAFDRLTVLADALDEAGCDNADILAHCRGPGPHVRGCWALDLILERQ
jgi:hypothetical protein